MYNDIRRNHSNTKKNIKAIVVEKESSCIRLQAVDIVVTKDENPEVATFFTSISVYS
ncbi:protein of unknown function [Petrocella atlantisensis]|uniref:Uncharacterized protein n=1 Tax=Petrocella atlantisensis TaxID=2173034 RepID=A0A3P7PZZ1_9FIRM|nr:protein of unknown function [Petrocella atlantisensis]